MQQLDNEKNWYAFKIFFGKGKPIKTYFVSKEKGILRQVHHRLARSRYAPCRIHRLTTSYYQIIKTKKACQSHFDFGMLIYIWGHLCFFDRDRDAPIFFL